MKLDDFVAETLRSLINGVKKAQESAEEAAAKVNPYRGSTEAVQDVEFDVQLTTTEGSATQGGVGVFVGPFGAGAKGQLEASAQTVGRIRFVVPVQLPEHPRRKNG